MRTDLHVLHCLNAVKCQALGDLTETIIYCINIKKSETYNQKYLHILRVVWQTSKLLPKIF